MAIEKPMIRGAASLIDWYKEIHTSPYWSVWDKNNMLFNFYENDDERSLELLEKQLTTCEDAGYDSVLKIKLHPAKSKNGYIDKDSPVFQALTFMLDCGQSQNGMALQSVGYANQDIYKGGKVDRLLANTEKLLEENNAIKSRLTALEMEDLDGAAGVPEDNSWDALMKGFLREPQKLTQMIGAVHNIIKLAKGENMVMAGMSGPGVAPGVNASDEQLLQNAIVRLRQHNPTLGADLQILASIAEQNKPFFDTIISQLRAMKQ